MSWVSKANARQRAGRAGRVGPGVCYKLFTKSHFYKMPDQEVPEIFRSPLPQLCLQVKLFVKGHSTTIAKFLSKALEPPPQASILSAVSELCEVNAITRDKEELTPLGYHLAMLPVDIYLGKMLIMGCLMKCIDPILTIAATMSYRTPFLSPLEKRAEAAAAQKEFGLKSAKSDHLAFLRAYEGWIQAKARGDEYKWCNEKFLSVATLKTIADLRSQFSGVLQEIGFLKSHKFSRKPGARNDPRLEGLEEKQLDNYDAMNVNSGNLKVVKAVLASGFYPKILRIDTPQATYTQMAPGTVRDAYDPQQLKLVTKTGERVYLHPKSVNFTQGTFEIPWLAYNEKVQTSKLYIRDCSMVYPFGLLLFSFGAELTVQHTQGVIVLDKWIQFQAPARIAVLVKEVRAGLLHILERKIENPDYDIQSEKHVDVVTEKLTKDGLF
eukprot:TRINITY_DN9407_c0_g1_i4.p1 TRINITY_DN9407_c0_g1~~TRINITY_DN9407_c0_g1_i4.p1  ORF type:complete len:475 (+),score=50.42 TRINITY_DN9407_c0_g1_i4:113-1426(+)